MLQTVNNHFLPCFVAQALNRCGYFGLRYGIAKNVNRKASTNNNKKNKIYIIINYQKTFISISFVAHQRLLQWQPYTHTHTHNHGRVRIFDFFVEIVCVCIYALATTIHRFVGCSTSLFYNKIASRLLFDDYCCLLPFSYFDAETVQQSSITSTYTPHVFTSIVILGSSISMQ